MGICLSEKNGVRARKKKQCALCHEPILPGELKDIRSGVNGSDFWTMHMHPECHAFESVPGAVCSDWYDEPDYPAFERANAIAYRDSHPPGAPES